MATNGPRNKFGAYIARLPMQGHIAVGARPAGAAGASVPVKPDLTAWDYFWKLDEGTGTVAYDTGSDVALDANLTFNGRGASVPSWVSGYYGDAVEFYADGTSDNAMQISPGIFNSTYALGVSGESFTVAVQLTSDTGEVSGAFSTILGNNDYRGTNDRFGFRIHWDYNALGLAFSVAWDSAEQVVYVPHATAGVSAGVNVVLMCVYDNPNAEIRVYVDGTLVGSDSVAGGDVVYFGSEYFAFGHTGDPSNLTTSVWGFNGTIDWAAIDRSAYDDAAAAAFYAGLSL